MELVVTKLWRPRPRSSHVPRAKQLALLDAGSEYMLTLVDAPAGAGKTTLLAQWLVARAAARLGCWLSLDRGDNDPTRFWSYVVMAIRDAITGFGASPLAALHGSADVANVVLPGLVNELVRANVRFALVIDDYHMIQNGAIHHQLERFLEHLPPGVQVVVSTREAPPLPLSRWRGRGQLAELRAADLRFDTLEARELFGRMDIWLTGEDVDRLVERTEGWAAGLSLAGLSVAGRDDPAAFVNAFAGTQRQVLDYFISEVLARQPPEARRFLVRASVLGRLSGELCDAVLERRGSGKLLAALERSNAFVVQLGDTREWYRLHHLFADALRSELRHGAAGLIPTLHRRASRWFASRSMTFDAIEHAVLARDPVLVADLLLPASFGYLGGGQAETVVAWLDRLGERAVIAEPRLSLIAATASLVRGDRPWMDRWLAFAEGTPYDGPLPGGPASIEAGVATIRGVVTSGRLSAHVADGRRAVELSADDTSLWRLLAEGGLGTALYWTGDAEGARPWLESTARQAPPLLSAAAYGFLAMAAVDLGDPAAAERLAEEGRLVAERHGLLASPPAGRLMLASGRARRQRHASAKAAAGDLEQAVDVLRGGPYPLDLADALLALAEARHAAGAEASARAALVEARTILERLEELGILAARWEAAERALSERPADRPAPVAIGELTDRERDVLALLPSDLSEAAIAAQLSVSFHTVHSHVRAIYRKLGTHTRAEAVERARAIGLLRSPLIPAPVEERAAREPQPGPVRPRAV